MCFLFNFLIFSSAIKLKSNYFFFFFTNLLVCSQLTFFLGNKKCLFCIVIVWVEMVVSIFKSTIPLCSKYMLTCYTHHQNITISSALPIQAPPTLVMYTLLELIVGQHSKGFLLFTWICFVYIKNKWFF